MCVRLERDRQELPYIVELQAGLKVSSFVSVASVVVVLHDYVLRDILSYDVLLC